MDYIFSSANPRIEPIYYIIAVVISILAGTVTGYYCRKGRITKAQSIAGVLLLAYIFLVFASTVFSRTASADYSYKLLPFWSYREIAHGSESLFWEDVLNVFMLLPVGVLLPAVMEGHVRDKRFIRAVLIGFLLSFSIEFLQLITKRGLFEFDDMFHNTLGVIIGYFGWQKIRGRR